MIHTSLEFTTLRDHWQITFVMLNRFCLLNKKTHTPLFLMDNSISSWMEYQAKSPVFQIWRYFLWKVTRYSHQFIYFLLFYISLYISTCNFSQTFQNFIQNYLKRDFTHEFRFLKGFHPNILTLSLNATYPPKKYYDNRITWNLIKTMIIVIYSITSY